MKGLLMTATSVTTLKKNIVFMLLCCTVLMMFVAGNTAAWAASCPTSPNYSPDFSSALVPPTCLALNGAPALSGYPGFYPPASTLTQPNGTPNPAQPPPANVAAVLRLTQNATFTSGSAWFNTAQPVAGSFSTTFTFQLSGASDYVADGFAFVIQNSSAGTSALDPDNGADGCSLGFGDAPDGTCTSTAGGITNSLAVEFDTYQNGDIGDPNANHVAIQSCGMSANSVEGPPFGGSCQKADNTLVNLLDPRGHPLTLADGYVHTVTITYSGPGTTLLDVILDGNDLFPGGVVFNMASIGLSSGNAYVGFTAATGGGDDNQDILSWTFTPGAQSAVLSTTTTAVLSFPNASGATAYEYTGQLTQSYPTPVMNVQPILMTQAACDALVQVNFWPARCFVYENAENTGLDSAVVFAVTCPDSPGQTCGSAADQNFFAQLGTGFTFLHSDNPFFFYPGFDSLLNPFPGWLKWPLPAPSTPLSPISPPAIGAMSNQISGFTIDPHVVGPSGGGGSYWVATYDTPGEMPPGITISSPTFTTYHLNQPVTANYTCSNPSTSQPAGSATGPYLTAASCTQSIGTQNSPCTFTPVGSQTGGLVCTGTVPTSSKGLHAFVVTAIDSGGNQNLDAVIYNVK
jgi:hypothetical protein